MRERNARHSSIEAALVLVSSAAAELRAQISHFGLQITRLLGQARHFSLISSCELLLAILCKFLFRFFLGFFLFLFQAFLFGSAL